MKDFLDLAKERYSCRCLSDREVEQEKIDKILRAGQLAPTAKNAQPIKIWVIKSEEAINKLKEVVKMDFGAKLFFLIGADRSKAFVRPFDNANFADVDGAIVATHMLLEIQELGLNTTWVGYIDTPRLQQLMPQLQGYDLIALFPTGYADEQKGTPGPRHAERKDLSELVEVL